MVSEICAAKIIETQFGISTYVWASVIAVTMFGLAVGYYLGGLFSGRADLYKLLRNYFLASGLLLVLMPLLANSIMGLLKDLNIVVSTVLSASLFLLPLMIIFGCVSPTLIQLATDKNNAGKRAGEIYSISTLGGVLFTVLVVLLIMPVIGISKTCFFFGGLLIFLGILLSKKFKLVTGIIGLIVLLLSNTIDAKVLTPNRINQIYNSSKIFEGIPLKKMDILYDESGLFGRISVVDITVNYGGVEGELRGLLVNNSWQTIIVKSNGKTLFDYVIFMESIVKHLPSVDQVLHIGLGGGHFSKLLVNMGKEVTAVELDSRIYQIAKKYFSLPNSVKVAVNDGRFYLNKNKEKYDLLILNAFQSVILPWNLFTKESFQKCYDSVKEDGYMIVEIGGYLDGNEDKILASVLQTIESVGWKTIVIKTKSGTDGDYICLAFKDKAPNFSTIQYQLGNELLPLRNHIIPRDQIKNSLSRVLTDDNPILTKWSSQREIY